MNLILLFVSVAFFGGYLLYIQKKIGPIKSISDSFYHIKPKWLFTIVMWGTAIPLMILGGTGLMFFAGAFICFVGAAPGFNDDKMEETVHVVGAEGGIVLAMAGLWINLNMWYLVIIQILFTVWSTTKLNNKFPKLHVQNHTYWIEVLAFVLVFTGLLFKRIL